MGIEGSNPSVSAIYPLTVCDNGIFWIPWASETAPARIFYLRRTVPVHIRPVLQEILASAGLTVFRRDAVIILKGTRASREFWAHLRTTAG